MIPVHPKAVRYSVKFYGFKKDYRWENKPASWVPGQTPPMDYGFPPAGPNEVVGDNYYFTVSSTWCAGTPANCLPKIPGWHEFYAAYGGRANIVIEITD
jgi:hypothetical protein